MSVSPIAALGRQAAEKPLVEKFAADTGLAPPALEKLAAAANLSVAALARAAYRAPQDFAKFAAARLNPAPAKPEPRPTVKTASALELTVIALAKKAHEKKAAANKKLSAMTLMNHFLDKVAAALPMTKQASIRVIQAELALGRPLSHAIKKACPTLTPEQRGFVAGKLTKAAADDFAKFVKKKQSGPQTATGKPGSPEVSKMMKAANAGVGLVARVANAGRNLLSTPAAAGRAGAKSFNAANAGAMKNRVQSIGMAGNPEAGPVGGLPIHRSIGAEHAKGLAAAKQQGVDDQLKARLLAALGLGGAGGAVLGGGGGQPAPAPKPQAQPQKPPTVRA